MLVSLTARTKCACRGRRSWEVQIFAFMNDQYVRTPLAQWKPDLPKGRIEKLYLHWSAGDYDTVYPAYHFCIGLDSLSKPFVAQTSDLRLNMRDVRSDPDQPYTAHTRGRNSFAAGLSIMCMQEAQPADFGAYPLTKSLIDALCLVSSQVATFYGIAVSSDSVMTHAEAAVIDGYFGTAPEQRWDIARLAPCAAELKEADAASVGDELRQRIASYRDSGTSSPSF